MEKIKKNIKEASIILKDLNLCILLIFLSILFTMFNSAIFSLLTFISIVFLIYSLHQLNNMMRQLEIDIKENLDTIDEEELLIKKYTELKRIPNDKKDKEKLEPNEPNEPNDKTEEIGIEDIHNIVENETEEKSENVCLDYKTLIEEEKEEKKEEEIDINKYIRKLGKGRIASQKAKDLALSYGYELKEGETFITPKTVVVIKNDK